MRHLFIPAAALVMLAACSENTSNVVGVDEPLAAATGSPHFIRNATGCTEGTLSLTCFFKETGLASGSVETIQIAVFATRDDSCVNNGGEIPNDPKKTTTSGIVTASGQFTAGKNGNVVGSLTVGLQATTLSCPPGQTATLISSNFAAPATISDLTSGASISVSGF